MMCPLVPQKCDMDGGSSMSESNKAETTDGFQPRTSE